jgi:hypothetical protein
VKNLIELYKAMGESKETEKWQSKLPQADAVEG